MGRSNVQTWTVVEHRKSKVWTTPGWPWRVSHLTGPGLGRAWPAKEYPIGTTITITITTRVQVRRLKEKKK